VIGVEGITVTEVRSHVLQKIGDRKIFVNSIEEAVRIRNGDREENVL
jgi:nitrogen regulatory protein PII